MWVEDTYGVVFLYTYTLSRYTTKETNREREREWERDSQYLTTRTRRPWCILCKIGANDRLQNLSLWHTSSPLSRSINSFHSASNFWNVTSSSATFDSNLKLVKKISRKYSRSDFGVLAGIVIFLFFSKYERRTVLSRQPNSAIEAIKYDAAAQPRTKQLHLPHAHA